MRVHTQRGFSFIEISVVLVIISLLVIGILAGQFLLLQSRLQGVVKSVQNYDMAVDLFEDYYGALPGDILNATTYWPNDSLHTGFQTFNGDGDGDLLGEELTAWQHLALAEMINGYYPGGSLVGNLVIGEHIPSSSFSNVGFYFVVDQTTSPNSNAIGIGSSSTINGLNLEGAAFSSYDARSIDQKYDDGDPANGNIRGFNDATATEACIDAADPNAYGLQDGVLACYMRFNL